MEVTRSVLILYGAALPMLLAFAICVRGYRRYGYHHYLLMALMWAFLGSGDVLLATAYLLLDPMLYRIGIVLIAMVTFLFAPLVDSISRTSIDPKKIALVSALLTGLAVTAFEPGAVGLNRSSLGEVGPSMQGGFRIWGSLVFLTSSVFWFYYMFRIYRNSPDGIRKAARGNFWASALAGPGAALAFATGLVWYLPGLDFLIIAISALFFSYYFYTEPKLAFILRFRVHGLYVISLKQGTTLFTHHWTPKRVEEMLFSGAITAIRMILQEATGHASIRKIEMDEGIFLLETAVEEELPFVLHTTGESRVLELSLKTFRRDFVRRVGIVREDVHVREQEARTLIQERFPYVPSVGQPL